MADFISEVKKRRTFAIISHPDAGKTTLTEKFLLYGGADRKSGGQGKSVRPGLDIGGGRIIKKNNSTQQ